MVRGIFLSHDNDRRRLPVALLSGFLGSGKTTLINALLRDQRMAGTAVAVNEFGPVPLDHDLIDHGADRTVVLANGCLCCNLAGDMEEAVMRLFSRRESGDVPTFSRLLIEPSGLSDPAPMMQALLRNPVMSRAFRLEAVATTVDSVFAEKQLAANTESRKQVSLADTLVLTKTDMVDADSVLRLQTVLRRLNPSASIDRAEHGAINASTLFPPAFFSPTAAEATIPRSAFYAEDFYAEDGEPSAHLGRIQAVALTAEHPLPWLEFDTWLRGVRLEYAEQLLRLKGLLNIVGSTAPIVVQGVHHVLHAPVVLPAWPRGESGSRLIVIVQDLSADILVTRWRDFLASNELAVSHAH